MMGYDCYASCFRITRLYLIEFCSNIVTHAGIQVKRLESKGETMPTIRIDDDVFAALQKDAKPFVDTPNSVLRRLLGLDEEGKNKVSAPMQIDGRTADTGSTHHSGRLGEDGTGSKNRRYSRASSGELLPQHEYADPILQVLYELGGSARSREIIDRLPEKMGHLLRRRDYEPTKRGDVRWRNRAQWARQALTDQGLLASDSPRGIWELSDRGRSRAKELVNGHIN